jgi:trehalose 6-phosphate synthase/phosphatase
MSHLKAVSSKFPVDVLWGNKVIEARPSGVNKGGAVRKVLAEYEDPDFVLCVGDDKTGIYFLLPRKDGLLISFR